MKGLRILSFVFVSLLSFSSCESDKDEETMEETNGMDSVLTNLAKQKINAQNVFTSLPGPQELTLLVEYSGLDYDAELLNNPDNLNRYTTDDAKALNLGIFGADLVYTNIYQQSQESMLFLKCVNSLCKNLGISGVFDERTVDRLEANKENRDSILTIVSKSFWTADEFLRNDGRPSTSSLMVAGGWLEGLYLSVKVAGSSKNNKILKKMSEQHESLKYLITLMEEAGVKGEAAFVLEGLRDLKGTYDKIQPNMVMDETQLKELDQKVSSLRKKIISI